MTRVTDETISAVSAPTNMTTTVLSCGQSHGKESRDSPLRPEANVLLQPVGKFLTSRPWLTKPTKQSIQVNFKIFRCEEFFFLKSISLAPLRTRATDEHIIIIHSKNKLEV